MPMMRGSRMVPPSSSGTPQRRQNTPNTASSSTTRRSHHSASSSPPATAWPATAAITGFESSMRDGPIGPSVASRSKASPTLGSRDAVLAGRGRHRFEIGAGAEGAVVAEQHAHARVVVALEREEGFGECRGGCPVDGVAYLRPAQDHGGDGTVLLGGDTGLAHALTSSMSAGDGVGGDRASRLSRPFRRARFAINSK